MREVKFRAWHKGRKKIYPVHTITFIGKAIQTPEEFEDEWIDFKRVDLMQYTGLEDKNGKEIYEGDILRWHHQNVKVVYWGMAFGFKGLKPYANGRVDYSYDTIINPDIKKLEDMEVIGSIYENPELL